MPEKRKKPWFYHDADAHRDHKLTSLEKVGGYEFIGYWWTLVEVLRETPSYSLPCESIGSLFYSLRFNDERGEKFLQAALSLGLLVKEHERIFSPSLVERMAAYDRMCAGKGVGRVDDGSKKGSERVRVPSASRDPDPVPDPDPYLIPSNRSFDPPGGSKKYLDWVFLDDYRFEMLVKRYKEEGFDDPKKWVLRAIELLDRDFEANREKRFKYTDDYKNLISWPLTECKKQYQNERRGAATKKEDSQPRRVIPDAKATKAMLDKIYKKQ